jgi:hypothetical protein
MNECCLRIEGFLSETFPVNLGVREGDIDSPPLFNLVYGEILRRSGLDLLDASVFGVNAGRVRSIAYADDLAALGVFGAPLQECLLEVADAMFPLNLRINAGKTNTVVFLTPRRVLSPCDVEPWFDFHVEGD